MQRMMESWRIHRIRHRAMRAMIQSAHRMVCQAQGCHHKHGLKVSGKGVNRGRMV